MRVVRGALCTARRAWHGAALTPVVVVQRRPMCHCPGSASAWQWGCLGVVGWLLRAQAGAGCRQAAPRPGAGRRCARHWRPATRAAASNGGVVTRAWWPLGGVVEPLGQMGALLGQRGVLVAAPPAKVRDAGERRAAAGYGGLHHRTRRGSRGAA